MKLLLVLSLIIGAVSISTVSATANASSQSAEQAVVVEFMTNVGWDSTTEYEETGRLMQDLLLELIQTDGEALDWVKSVNEHFASEYYSNLSEEEKQRDIFAAKFFAKMYIFEVLLK